MSDSTTCLCGPAGALIRAEAVHETVDTVVRQAHDRLAPDLTLVALPDELSGCLRIRGSRGTELSGLQQHRLPAELDRVMASEHLVRLHSVTLEAGGGTVGVLYAGFRSERRLDGETLAWLEDFAELAAAALCRSVGQETGRSALEDLTRSYAAAESALHRARQQARAHEVLTTALLEGGTAEKVVGALAEALGGRVWLLAPGGDLLAESRPQDAGDPRAEIVVPVSTNGTTAGALALARPGTLGSRERRTLELAAEVLGVLLGRPAGLAGDGDLPLQLASLGPRGDLLRVVLVAGVGRARQAAATAALEAMAEQVGGVAGHYRGWPTLLVDGDDIGRTAHNAQRELAARLGAPVVVCAHLSGADEDRWRSGHALAVRGCQLLQALGVEDRAATTDDLKTDALLLGDAQGPELRAFLDRALGPLITYDAKRGTDLVATLATYLDASGNNAHTARALGIHLNTALKRFGRIDDLIGDDWRSPGRAFDLQLAVRMHRIAQGRELSHIHPLTEAWSTWT